MHERAYKRTSASVSDALRLRAGDRVLHPLSLVEAQAAVDTKYERVDRQAAAVGSNTPRTKAPICCAIAVGTALPSCLVAAFQLPDTLKLSGNP